MPSRPFSPHEQEVVDTVLAFLHTWTMQSAEAVEHALGFVAEGFTGLGTGPGDYYPDRPSVGALFQREKAEMPEAPVSFDLPWVTVRLLRSDLALVEAQIRSEVVVGGQTHLVEPRCTFVLERHGGRWLIAHMHFSMADAMQREGDTLVEALERRTTQLEREVAERTAELEQSLADLKAAQARLVQTEKMASLGALTAGIAHEIKNPLNFVTNFATLSQELLDDLDDETDPEERATLLSDLRTNATKIEAHGRRADAIVRSMMAHARSGSGERRAVDLNGLVQEYAGHALHALKVRKPAFDPMLTFDLADDAGEVEMVGPEIGRVLVNLVDNALDAVRRHAHGPGVRPTVTVATRRLDGVVEIRVSDTGPGLADAALKKVFEPFFTTKPAGEGTGLGLSLSHDIVAQGHGGSLTAESVPGEGALFIVRLPTS